MRYKLYWAFCRVFDLPSANGKSLGIAVGKTAMKRQKLTTIKGTNIYELWMTITDFDSYNPKISFNRAIFDHHLYNKSILIM